MDRKTFLQVKMKMSKFTILDYVKKTIEQQQEFLEEQNERIENMYSDYNDLLEYRQVTLASKELMERDEVKEIRERISSFSEASIVHDPEESMKFIEDNLGSEIGSEMNVSLHGGVKIGRIVGTCMNDDLLRLKRLLFRSTRGNVLVLTKNTGGIETFEKKIIPKSVFIVVFQDGEQLRKKIEHITQNFSKNRYNLPNVNIEEKLRGINDKIEQTRQLIVMSLVGIEKYLVNCTND